MDVEPLVKQLTPVATLSISIENVDCRNPYILDI